MNVTGVQLTLLIGEGVPLPATPDLLQALQSVHVEETEEGPSTAQLTFQADPSATLDPFNPIGADPRLKVYSRVVIVVTMDLVPTVLFDGLITHQQLQPGSSRQPWTMTVTCEDISVVMTLTERSVEHVCQDYTLAATTILERYLGWGIEPEVVPSLIEDPPLPEDSGLLQNDTDRGYLADIAARVGHVFYVIPGPVPLVNRAYWGPRVTPAVPQPALSYDLGAATNVSSLHFSFSPTEATLVAADALEEAVGPPEQLPVYTFTSEGLPLAAEPALVSVLPNIRESLVQHGGADVLQTTQLAQARTDRSTYQVATATGELDALVYGHVLRARGLVGVRGAGMTFDGTWYVRSVAHDLRRGAYTQSFTLNRDGTIATSPVVLVE